MTTKNTSIVSDIGKLAVGEMMSGVSSAMNMVTSISSNIMDMANTIS